MRRLISLFALLALIGCKKENVIEPIPSRAFQYNAYDTTGTLLINGWCTLIIEDSIHIGGEWHFKEVNNPQNIGPHVGDGQLVGSFQGNSLSINLNPNFVDNNIILSGKINQNDYSGTWEWISFPGIKGRGRFDAHR